MIGGIGRFKNISVVVLGQEKGHDLETRMKHNFGMAKPEGYRKAQRLMDMADKFNMPVLAFVDTAGAYPGVEAEARAYKKKNLIQSNYPYDSQNYAEAAAYYLKAAEAAPDAGRKLSSLDGAASMYWNLDDKKQWCRVKLQQVPSVSDKDKTRLYMDIARETADKKQQKELYAKALAYAAQMSGDDDVRAETVNRLKKLTE